MRRNKEGCGGIRKNEEGFSFISDTTSASSIAGTLTNTDKKISQWVFQLHPTLNSTELSSEGFSSRRYSYELRHACPRT